MTRNGCKRIAALCALLFVSSVLAGCRGIVPPAARFHADPLTGAAPLEVQFTDESAPGSSAITGWTWDFGDGATSAEPNPSHVYREPGHYTVSLVVTGDSGQDTWTCVDMIRVSGSEDGEPAGERHTYYVAPNGDDGQDGSAAHPWLTIQHAAESVSRGDSVLIAPGTYDGDVDLPASGTQEAPIAFRGDSVDAVVIHGHVQLAQGVSHVELASLTVQGFPIWGVTLIGDNHHVHLHDLKVIGGEAGIRFTDGNSGEAPAEGPVSDVVLENSEIQGPLYTAVDCTPGPCDRMVFRNLEVHDAGLQGEASFGADGIGLERGQDVLVEDCYVHDNGGDGIDLNSRNFQGNATGILVRRNRVVRNHLMGIKLWAGGRMENNVVWGQGITPVLVGKYPGTYEVVNNSIAFNMYDSFAERDYALVAGYPNDDTGVPPELSLVLVNNLFAFNTSPAVGDGPTGIYLGANVHLSESHNLFWSREDGEIQAEFVSRPEKAFARAEIPDGTWAAETGQGAGDTVLDPRLTAPWPHVDLALAPGSPAADAGTDAGAPSTDVQGTPRPQGAGYSIGAYER